MAAACIPAEVVEWSTILRAPWAELDSMSMLQARASLHSLGWRARTQFLVGSRCFHLLASRVCLGALRKHFNRVTSIIPASPKIISVYIAVEVGPAEHPSRQLEQWRRRNMREE